MGRQLQMWEEDSMSELASLFAVKSKVGLLDYQIIINSPSEWILKEKTEGA